MGFVKFVLFFSYKETSGQKCRASFREEQKGKPFKEAEAQRREMR